MMKAIISDESSMEDASVTTSESESNKERIQKSRCRSEKKRRDKLNLYINDLQMMLSPSSNKRLDKSSVLKMTVDYLKMHNDLSVNINSQGKVSKPFFLPCKEVGHLMLEIFNGFIIVINEDAKFVYVAEIVENILGVKASYFADKTVHTLIHKEDQKQIIDELISGSLKENLTDDIDILTGSRSMSSKVTLKFRVLIEKDQFEAEYRSLNCGGQWFSFKKDESQYGGKLLVLVACLNNSGIREINTDNNATSSFSSKHSLDGKFLFVDPDCPRVIGFLPYELLGKSIYIFVHDDDLLDLKKLHEEITKTMTINVMSVYVRFRSKGEEWILFKLDFKLILKTGSPQAEQLYIKFVLANSKETHTFRRYSKEKQFCIENYIPDIFKPSIHEAKKFKSTESIKPVEEKKTNSVSQETKSNPNGSKKESSSSNVETKTIPTEIPVGVSSQPERREEETPANFPTRSSYKHDSPLIGSETYEERGDEESYKDKELFFEAQHNLHNQLKIKHETLTQLHIKQKEKLENVGAMMAEYNFFMQAPSFKGHYKQQIEMYEYLQYMLKKQHRKQEYLFKLLKGKIKELEIKQRAIKLREMAFQQQKALAKMKESHEEQRKLLDQSSFIESEDFQPQKIKNSTSSPVTSPLRSSIDLVSSSQPMTYTSNGAVTNNTWNTTSPKSSRSLYKCSEPKTQLPHRNSPVGFNLLQSQLYQLQLIQKEHAQFQQQQQPPQSHQQQSQQQDDVQRHSQQQQPNHLKQQQTMTKRNVLQTQQNEMLQLNALHLQLKQQTLEKQPAQQLIGTDFSEKDVVDNESSKNELQRTISKQILVHLQVLQRHVLNQLQSLIQNKNASTNTDFSKIIPVLQQLQQLQQYIIIQQQSEPCPGLPTSQQVSSQQVYNQQVSNQQATKSYQTIPTAIVSSLPVVTARNVSQCNQRMYGFMNAASNTDLLMVQSLAQQPICKPTSITNETAYESSPIKETASQSIDTTTDDDSAFGNLQKCERKLGAIKKDFLYQEEEKDSKPTKECFGNLASPDLSSLLNRNAFDNNGNRDDDDNNNNDDDEDLKKENKLNEENLSNFQPLMNNQQQLAQLQQHQRMQIFMQQQRQLQVIQSQQTSDASRIPNLDEVHQPNSATEQSRENGDATASSSNDQTNVLTNFVINSQNEFAIPSATDLTSWMPPENEEGLNMMCLNENDIYW